MRWSVFPGPIVKLVLGSCAVLRLDREPGAKGTVTKSFACHQHWKTASDVDATVYDVVATGKQDTVQTWTFDAPVRVDLKLPSGC